MYLNSPSLKYRCNVMSVKGISSILAICITGVLASVDPAPPPRLYITVHRTRTASFLNMTNPVSLVHDDRSNTHPHGSWYHDDSSLR